MSDMSISKAGKQGKRTRNGATRATVIVELAARASGTAYSRELGFHKSSTASIQSVSNALRHCRNEGWVEPIGDRRRGALWKITKAGVQAARAIKAAEHRS